MVEEYCNKWRLSINCTKTKITVFGENVKDQEKYNFVYKGGKLEVVNSFKYLGVTFNWNGSFKNCIIDLKAQASRAMFALIAKGRKLSLPVDIMF